MLLLTTHLRSDLDSAGHTFTINAIPPSNWRWGPAFQEALLGWLRELQWMPGLGPVPCVEPALDFEAHSGRSMPASPGGPFST